MTIENQCSSLALFVPAHSYIYAAVDYCYGSQEGQDCWESDTCWVRLYLGEPLSRLDNRIAAFTTILEALQAYPNFTRNTLVHTDWGFSMPVMAKPAQKIVAALSDLLYHDSGMLHVVIL